MEAVQCMAGEGAMAACGLGLHFYFGLHAANAMAAAVLCPGFEQGTSGSAAAPSSVACRLEYVGAAPVLIVAAAAC